MKNRSDGLNAKTNPLSDGEDPPAERLQCTFINVKGRREHEALIRDHKRCEDLGLDIFYEMTVYLKRWGGWLNAGLD